MSFPLRISRRNGKVLNSPLYLTLLTAKTFMSFDLLSGSSDEAHILLSATDASRS